MRVGFAALTALMLAIFLGQAQATTRLPISVPTSHGEVLVECFAGSANAASPTVLVLSGSKGFGSPAYDEIGQTFHDSGLNACLVHFLTPADLSAIAKAGSSQARVSYYATRQTAWVSDVQSVISYFNAHSQPISKVGVLGISLGAEIAAVVATNSTDIGALVIVDGGYPDNYSQSVHSLPPLHLIWGSADRTFPLSVGVALQRMAKHLGDTASLDVYEGGAHNFFLLPKTQQAQTAHRSAAHFLATQLKPQ
jgi:dienelactone hydrolase